MDLPTLPAARVLLAASAFACFLFLADSNDAASGIGRSLPAEGPAPRYVVIGNSEANAILTHSPDVFHLWESRATFIDRLLQLRLALDAFRPTEAILVSVHPAELAVSPHCLLFRTSWPVGNENASAISRRALAVYRHASVTDILANPGRLLDALDAYLRLDPVRLFKRWRGTLPQGPVYRANGSRFRDDPRQLPMQLMFDSFSSDAFRSCITSVRAAQAGQGDALEVARTLITASRKAGVPIAMIVTPLHPAYRASLDSFLDATLPNSHLSVASLIGRLATLGVPVIDDSRLFDHEHLVFLNGNHLSSSGEHVYAPLLLPRLRALCFTCR